MMKYLKQMHGVNNYLMRILYVTILSALILFFIPLSTVYAEQELSNKQKNELKKKPTLLGKEGLDIYEGEETLFDEVKSLMGGETEKDKKENDSQEKAAKEKTLQEKATEKEYIDQESPNKEKYTTQQLQRMRDEVRLKDAVVKLMEIPLYSKDAKNVVGAMRAHINTTIKINPELGMQLRNFCNSVNCYQIANDKQTIAAIINELKKEYAQYELILSPETAEQEKVAQEKAAQEKAAQEKEKVAKERLLLEKAAQEKAAQEKAAQEKAAQERLLLEKAAQDKRATERMWQDLFAKTYEIFKIIIPVVLIFALLFFLHRRETRLDSDIMHNILRADKPGLSIVRLFTSKEKRREKHEKFSSKYLEKLRNTLAEMFVIASSATQKAHDEDMELIEAKKREIEKEQNAIEILNARIEEEKLIFKDLKSRHSFLEGMVKNR